MADVQTPTRTPRTDRSERLRYIPPAAALGTAYVLQIILVTDLLGEVLAGRQAGPPWVWYLAAGLLGLAFASCLEGGAAYLMDLYDKHLLARDSVWVLRVLMVGYVAGSAALIHWWLSTRGLPELIAWALAAMSGSALLLWSRGSRWRNREAMREAGQIDPALPKFPLATKLLHPVRTAVTVWLISWGPPVRTLDGARRRYEAWHRLRQVRKASRQTAGRRASRRTPKADLPTGPVRSSAGPDPSDPTGVESEAPQPRRRTAGVRRRGPARALRSTDDDQVLATLRQTFPDRTPSINEVQQTVGGGRSRAIRLRGLLTEGSAPDEGSDDDMEVDAA